MVVPCLPAQPLWRGGRRGRLFCSIQALFFRVFTICTLSCSYLRDHPSNSSPSVQVNKVEGWKCPRCRGLCNCSNCRKVHH